MSFISKLLIFLFCLHWLPAYADPAEAADADLEAIADPGLGGEIGDMGAETLPSEELPESEEALPEIETHLVAEGAQGPGTGAVFLARPRFPDETHHVQVLFHRITSCVSCKPAR